LSVPVCLSTYLFILRASSVSGFMRHDCGSRAVLFQPHSIFMLFSLSYSKADI